LKPINSETMMEKGDHMMEKRDVEKEARMHLVIDKFSEAMKQRVTKQCMMANKKPSGICHLRSQDGFEMELARYTKTPDLVQHAIDVACLWDLDCAVSVFRGILKAGKKPVNHKFN
jgi:hypothetical protein